MDPRPEKLTIAPEAADTLAERAIVHDLDRSGVPHVLIKVPDLAKAVEAELGIEIHQEPDGCIALSILLYDIPSEPVSYDLRLYPDQPDDLRFLRAFLEHKRFRLRPCEPSAEGWSVGPVQTLRLPPAAVLRLKHYSLSWPAEPAPEAPAPEPEPDPRPSPPANSRPPDPRDTVIRKLKEQVESLREQLRQKDKRIIELEDELHELKSRGRSYRLGGERKPWWKPFS